MIAEAIQLESYLKILTAMAKENGQSLGGYGSIAEFVLRQGRPMTPCKRPSDVKQGTMKECYANAGRLAINRSDLTYCEGYAISIIPTIHAWCIDKAGNVVDPTWKEGIEYYGIPFSTRFLRRWIAKYGVWGLIDNWPSDWPLLRIDPKEYLWID